MGASVETAFGRVGRWRDRWPQIANDVPRDANGQPAQYTFFYPQEEYRRDLIDRSQRWCVSALETSRFTFIMITRARESFTEKIREYCRRLTQDHGLLRQQDGRTVFGFIHGNWALDNSRPDGKWCGLNGEIALLQRTRLLCRFHDAIAAVPHAGPDCQSDLLVHQ